MKYKFSMREIKCIMKQLIEVLDYLSEKKILHRDIKSSNRLLSNRHHVKLAVSYIYIYIYMIVDRYEYILCI